MPKSTAVWGIDIGQSALKALRCSVDQDGEGIVADAFDYVEYPKILSQPEADPAELVRDALKQFLSRNSVRGDKVAISVPGQSGLARFIKLPPVEAKKIPSLVKYEARQQIPFSLDEVIWDYQQMSSSQQDGDVTSELEVGLFAMKRDQVFRALQPFEEAGIELDVVQLAPLCIYNFAVYDLLSDLPLPESDVPGEPPPWLVVLSLGTDTTDLVVSNGIRVWLRSIPLGGNHFSKALSKELKLTFAKAEHLKRHVRQSEDAKAVIQAMRPVFSDLETEVQRSIGYFQGMDRQAKITRVVTLGNAMRLPGLQAYLANNLGYEVTTVREYSKLRGSSVVGSPAFKENLLSFAVSYGLAIQGLGKGKLSTNLLPRELLTARLIRAKKPWAAAAAAVLLLGCSLNYLFHWNAWTSSVPDLYRSAFSQVDSVKRESDGHKKRDTDQKAQFEHLKALGEEVVGNNDRELLWPELLMVIDAAMPRDPNLPLAQVADKPLPEQPYLHIETFDNQPYADLATWFATVRASYAEGKSESQADGSPEGAAPPPAATDPGAVGTTPVSPTSISTGAAPTGAPLTADTTLAQASNPAQAPPPSAAGAATGPTGAGWVIELKGFHFHNSDIRDAGAQYLRRTLLKNLEEMSVDLPRGPSQDPIAFTMKELGIGYPVLIGDAAINQSYEIKNPDFIFQTGELDEERGLANRPTVRVPRCDFTVQFCWQPRQLSERLNAKKEQQAAQAAAAAQPANPNPEENGAAQP